MSRSVRDNPPKRLVRNPDYGAVPGELPFFLDSMPLFLEEEQHRICDNTTRDRCYRDVCADECQWPVYDEAKGG